MPCKEEEDEMSMSTVGQRSAGAKELLGGNAPRKRLPDTNNFSFASPIMLSVDFVFLLLARHSLCQHNSALAVFVGSAEIEHILLCSRLLAEFFIQISCVRIRE